MKQFSPEVHQAAAREREVQLTTHGRKTGQPHRVTIWIGTDGGHLYIRSGQGFRRDWPQNLVARGEGVLHLGKLTVKVKPRHVTDPDKARAVSALYKRKYGPFVRSSKPGQPRTDGELATFELLAAENGS